MDVRLVERLGVKFVFDTTRRHRHPVRRPPARLRRDRDHGRRHEPGLPRRPGRGPRRRPVRRRLHEEGEPRPGARGRPQRRRHRRRLHRDGLLAHEPPLRRRERDHRLPPHPVRARRGRGGAGRDRARGRQPRVPRQPDRADRRGRQADRRPVHPQQAGRARRVRPPLAGADRGLRVRRPGRHRHPRRVPGRRPHVPPGRGELRGQPRPDQGRPGDVRDQRPRRVRLRRLRDRPDDAHRERRPRQEGRLRDRPLPRRPHGRDRHPERQDHQLVAPRHARVLRRAPAPAHPDGPARDPDAVHGSDGQLHDPGRARLRRDGRGGRVHPLPDVQLQHLVRPVPVRAVRRLRRRLPRGRHPHGRREPAEDRGPAARDRGGLRLVAGRRHDPRRGALHPLCAVRQAVPLRRHHHGAVRAPGDLERRPALQGVLP